MWWLLFAFLVILAFQEVKEHEGFLVPYHDGPASELRPFRSIKPGDKVQAVSAGYPYPFNGKQRYPDSPYYTSEACANQGLLG